ncbi:hypothetical protein Vretimale_15255, partial [Volvox reticuliferus]
VHHNCVHHNCVHHNCTLRCFARPLEIKHSSAGGALGLTPGVTSLQLCPGETRPSRDVRCCRCRKESIQLSTASNRTLASNTLSRATSPTLLLSRGTKRGLARLDRGLLASAAAADTTVVAAANGVLRSGPFGTGAAGPTVPLRLRVRPSRLLRLTLGHGLSVKLWLWLRVRLTPRDSL